MGSTSTRQSGREATPFSGPVGAASPTTHPEGLTAIVHADGFDRLLAHVVAERGARKSLEQAVVRLRQQVEEYVSELDRQGRFIAKLKRQVVGAGETPISIHSIDQEEK